jgi:thiosulfate/3-mercaptopyruvate sulfurtransferase
MEKRILVLLFGLIFGIIQPAASEDVSLLVSPAWLHEHLHDPNLVVLQVSFLKLDYDREHIEKSEYLWPGSLAPDSPEGSLNIPDLKKATELLESLGISNTTHVVVSFCNNDVSMSSRIFLTLEYLGLKGHVSFLDGGLEGWKKAGFLPTTEVPVVKKGSFTPHVDPVIVDHTYVLNHLNTPNTIIVDARMKRYYDGEPVGNPRDGHITGAKNIPYTDLINQNRFKSLDQLQSYFTPVDPTKSKELVTYCFIGQTASVVYLAGRMLGYTMKLYDGSMQEWSRMKELPMEVTPPEPK